jgi:hypothetical protein
VELNGVQIGTLAVSGGAASVSITGTMPDFMQVARIWLEPGGHILYDNGPKPAVALTPGTYQVKATLRAKPRSDIYGRTADLTLTCNGTPTATITLRVPNPNEWGLRADIYTFTTAPAPWPPFGANYTYRGTWSVGAIHFWLGATADPFNRVLVMTPYTTIVVRTNVAPKWVAYWLDPTATEWKWWAVKFTGRLYVPWSSIRVGVWHDDGVYVKLCDIDTGNSRWNSVGFYITSGTCAGAPGEYDVEIGYFDYGGWNYSLFIIAPGGGNEAYVPTIDGAWRCPDFDWNIPPQCYSGWSFVAASPSVPYFVATNYTPGSTDGGGTPRP